MRTHHCSDGDAPGLRCEPTIKKRLRLSLTLLRSWRPRRPEGRPCPALPTQRPRRRAHGRACGRRGALSVVRRVARVKERPVVCYVPLARPQRGTPLHRQAAEGLEGTHPFRGARPLGRLRRGVLGRPAQGAPGGRPLPCRPARQSLPRRGPSPCAGRTDRPPRAQRRRPALPDPQGHPHGRRAPR